MIKETTSCFQHTPGADENTVCSVCKEKQIDGDYDPCIGKLIGVKNACCGHGDTKEAYVQFDHVDYKDNPNAFRIGGRDALDYIERNKQV